MLADSFKAAADAANSSDPASLKARAEASTTVTDADAGSASSADSSGGKNATRERILEAAAQVFAESGYHGASVDDIAQTAGGSKGAIYFHFPGKRAIFFALVNRFADRLLANADASIIDHTGGVRQAGAAIESTLRTFSDHARLAKVLLASGVGLGPAFDESLLSLHDRFAALIRERLDTAVADGSIAPVDTTLASYAWMGALNEIILRWLYTGTPSPLTSAAPQLKRILLASVGAGQPLPEPSGGAEDGA